MSIVKHIGFIVAASLLMLQAVSAQRPSFAGIRPPGGLNQKDKYLTPQNTIAGSSDNAGIANRFGGDQPEPVTIAYGAAQRPPSGVVLVHPETLYVPLPGSGMAAPAAPASPSFSVNNRIGESATPTQNASGTATATATAGANSSTANSAQPPAAANVPSRLPIDAHGDNDLIQQLGRLPIEKQPFWFVNYQAIEAHRNSSRPGVGALETRGSFFGG